MAQAQVLRIGLEATDKRTVALTSASLFLGALQTIPLRHEHAEERLARRWSASALLFLALWVGELVAFFCAILNTALHTITTTLAGDNPQNWQTRAWVAWASVSLLLLAWLSEFLVMTVKARSNEVAYEWRRARSYVRPRVPLDRPEDDPAHGPLLLSAAAVAVLALAMAVAAVALAATRGEDLKLCRHAAVSHAVLGAWVVVSFVSYLLSVSTQMFLWDTCFGWNIIGTVGRLSELYRLELAVAIVEAFPCVLVSALAVATLAPRSFNGCETIARRLAAIGLAMAVGPVAKVARQLGRRFYGVRHVPPVADRERDAVRGTSARRRAADADVAAARRSGSNARAAAGGTDQERRQRAGAASGGDDDGSPVSEESSHGSDDGLSGGSSESSSDHGAEAARPGRSAVQPRDVIIAV